MSLQGVADEQQKIRIWLDETAKLADNSNLQLEVQPGIQRFDPKVIPIFTPRKLIGLSGLARCGKDTLAKMLYDAFRVERISFAEPIREALRAMMGLTDEHFHGELKEVPIPWLGKSPRQLMQTLGTEWGREIVNDSLWLLIAEQKIKAFHDDMKHVVVTDVRFENEADFIRANGGVVWHITRANATKVQIHASESGIAFKPQLGDIRIENNGTLDELFDEAVDNF